MLVFREVLLVLMASACLAPASAAESGYDDMKVTVSTGTLVGRLQNSASGKPYKVFLKIPYAKPPIGTLRFKPPEPSLPWAGERSAKMEAPPCPQYEPFVVKNFIGREDCLYANVYAPATRSKELRPVFVFIHGGAFATGVSAWFWYNPVHLMDGEAIVVTFNYRLNVFGFLTMKNELAPGNLGFRDTLQALEWVNREIANFGGDPNRVTVAGHSAGGVMASMLLYVKEASGLFSQVILFSGSALCPFAFRSQATEASSEDVIGTLGCGYDDPQETLACLQKVKTIALQKAAHVLAAESSTAGLFLWTPRVDAELRSPLFRNQITRDTNVVNNVPMMIGISRDDGLVHPLSDKFSEKHLRKLNDTWLKECPQYLLFDFQEPTRVKSACQSARQEYFGPTGEIDESKGFDLIELLRDRIFGVCSLDLAEEMRKSKPVYMYSFQFVPNNISVVDIADTFLQVQDRALPQYRGSTHSTDMTSLFRVFISDARATKFGAEANRIVRSTFISRILNFVEYGNPNGPKGLPSPRIPKWPLYESTMKRHFVFDVFPRISQHILSERRVDFWRSFDNGLRKRVLLESRK